MKINPLIPIGSKIKIDKSKIKNQFQKKLLDDLPQIISGKVIDYKMTDGMGIGYVLITDNDLKIWIFNSELNYQTKKEYQIEDANESTLLLTKDVKSRLDKVNYEIGGNRSIKTIANPVNIVSWLIFTLKDIF
tara:strand:- start:1658 stop:2056 length:399 start_codon:yes stop_codon:yes gene_type:complete